MGLPNVIVTPGAGAENPFSVYGRLYSCSVGAGISVPGDDANVLISHGWLLVANTIINLGTVETLPAAAVAMGMRYFVTDSHADADSSTFGETVIGSGVYNVPVWSDGTNWRIG